MPTNPIFLSRKAIVLKNDPFCSSCFSHVFPPSFVWNILPNPLTYQPVFSSTKVMSSCFPGYTYVSSFAQEKFWEKVAFVKMKSNSVLKNRFFIIV